MGTENKQNEEKKIYQMNHIIIDFLFCCQTKSPKTLLQKKIEIKMA